MREPPDRAGTVCVEGCQVWTFSDTRELVGHSVPEETVRRRYRSGVRSLAVAVGEARRRSPQAARSGYTAATMRLELRAPRTNP